MPRVKDIAGTRQGRLTVVRLCEERGKKHRTYWLCHCDCGKELRVLGQNLTNGNTMSCGCVKRHSEAARGKHKGLSSLERYAYSCWNGMKARCYRKSHPAFYKYGGRGIEVCEEWMSFETFCGWAVANGLRQGLSVDRINNDLGYSPHNCRVATPTEQNNNKRNNTVISFGDKSMTVAAWADELSISANTIYWRLSNGWTVEKALTVRPENKRKQK